MAVCAAFLRAHALGARTGIMTPLLGYYEKIGFIKNTFSAQSGLEQPYSNLFNFWGQAPIVE
jgi:hypothetical protein